MPLRNAKLRRTTKETDVSVSINLDKLKPVKVKTTVPFMDHMLDLFAHHAGVSLVINAKGDTHIDDHHLIEDIGIVFGTVLKKAIGNKKGIARYGNFLLPMDEALAHIVIDISGRPYLDYKVKFQLAKTAKFDFSLLKEFFYAFAINAGVTLHIRLLKGDNNHHIAESMFKGLGRALSQACARDPKRSGIPSTKGKL